MHLLFLPFSTTSSHLHAHTACKLCSISVSKVCFIYFITSNCFLVVFYASGDSKSPRWHASHPHHQHKPSNEAYPCATPINDYYNIPTINSDNNDCLCLATSTKTALIPIQANLAPPTSRLVPIATVHGFCTPQEYVVCLRIQHQLSSWCGRHYVR